MSVSDEEQREYLKLREEHHKVGRGELESIVVCLKRRLSFTSFDKRAISTARNLGVSIIPAGTIFKGLIAKGIATKDEVLKIIEDIEVSDNRILELEVEL